MDDFSELQEKALKPIFHELGMAVYYAQQFETNLLLLLSILTTTDSTVTAKSFKKSVDLYIDKKKTLGQMAGILKSKLSLPDDVTDNFFDHIKTGIEARNTITHGFIMKHTENFLTIEGRKSILQELIKIQTVLHDRLKLINSLLDSALKVFGGTLEQIKQQVDFCFEPDAIDEITRH